MPRNFMPWTPTVWTLRPVCLCVAALLVGLPAFAAETVEPVDTAEIAVVGVHLADLDDAAAQQASERVVQALRATGRLDPLDPAAVSARIAGREQLVLNEAFLGPGERALDEGRVLYERAEFDDAMATLGQAVDLLTEAMPAMTDNRLLIDALLMQGLTHFSIGDNDPARRAFEQVCLLDPSRRLDPVNYSGPTVEFFDAARAAVDAKGVGSIAVDGEAGNAVFVDGRARGETPLQVDALPAGQHSILVVGVDGTRAFSQVTVSVGDAVTVKPKLSRGFVEATAVDDAARSRRTAQIYRALASYSDTGLVLLAGESAEGDLDVQLYQPRTGNFSTILSEPRGDDPVATLESSVGGLVDLLDEGGSLRTDAVYPRAAPLAIGTNPVLLSMLLDPEPVAGVSALTPGVGQDEGGGVPWVVWAGVGAVAAGGTAVGAVLLSGNKQTEAGGGTIIVGPMP